jgi:hypothetical protein
LVSKTADFTYLEHVQRSLVRHAKRASSYPKMP